MTKPEDILKKYWGFDSFRNPQEEVISSVLQNKDTLALMPTGGGKSICFQVPALAREGICIVISPLIALMKDQVEDLKRRNIKALSITSEYRHEQIDAMLDRCIYEDIKFLYLSPERLKTELAQVRIRQMKVNLIAVDEAHCISEWGYDFRPSYLEIASLRALHPTCPVIALTASATPVVVDDIMQKLEFKEGTLIRKSFERPNLAYFVRWEEDKLGTIAKIARKQGGSGIVYVRSRKGAERIANALLDIGLSATHYHAGLPNEERSERQQKWMNNRIQIIVATNAFGMGIDKPNVRFVIHTELPDTLENYYQECGRAGRDGLKSYAVSLLLQPDLDRFKKRQIESFPSKDQIRNVYDGLGSFLQLAVGGGSDEAFTVDLEKFTDQFGSSRRHVEICLKFLEKEGYLAVEEQSHLYSVVQMTATHSGVMRLRENNKRVEPLIDALLRSYGRLFDEEVNVSEFTLARRTSWNKAKVSESLNWLEKGGFLKYTPASNAPRMTFVDGRLAKGNLRFSNEHYDLRKHVLQDKAHYMLSYATAKHKCRGRMLLEYFGETDAQNCGHCDFCLQEEVTKHPMSTS